MSDRYTPATRTRPCPICGRTKYCSFIRPDADHPEEGVWCSQETQPPPGWYLVKQTEDGAIFSPTPPKTSGSKPSWDERARGFERSITSDHLDALQETLCLPLRSIKALHVGWNQERRCYTIPERNAAGDVTTLNYRTPEGAKYGAKHGRRGLFVPDGLFSMSDPVLVVEGWTDTAALHAIGLAAVGRPNDRGGVAELSRLLRNRDVIIVGEFDPKQDGRWPGRDGALHVADKLALAWGEAVEWSMCPDGEKDSRQWVTRRIDDAEPEELGRRFVASLRNESRSARGDATLRPEDRPLVANVVDDATTDAKKVRPMAVPAPHIASHLRRLTDDWPRRVGGLLFTARTKPPDNGELPSSRDFRILRKADDLFGWCHGEGFDVRWTSADAFDRVTNEPRTPCTKAEFYSYLAASAEPHYESVETLPHEPPIEGAFYLPMKMPTGTGDALAELVEHLNPATELDRDLMVACFLTMAWGGPPGRRPGFVFTSEFGRGSGKTRTATMLAGVWGGVVSVGEFEDWDRVRSRLLSDDALSKRAILIDNIRGRLARSGLESAITSDTIDGHRLYAGQFRRPNNLTWLFTANTPALTQDLATRSVVIRLGPPQHGSDFEEWSERFFRIRRAALIADATERLRRGPVTSVAPEARDRWAPWTAAVLCTFPNAEALNEYIVEGRPAVDQDRRDAEDVAGIIGAICRKMNADPELHKVAISKRDLRTWLVAEGIFEARMSPKGMTTRLLDLAGLPPLAPLSESRRHGAQRQWLWSPPGATTDAVYEYELERDGGPVIPGERHHRPYPASHGSETGPVPDQDQAPLIDPMDDNPL